MSEELNHDAIKLIIDMLMDSYKLILSGQGFEEFAFKLLSQKAMGMMGLPLGFMELLLAVNSFHALTIFDIEEKIKAVAPDQLTNFRMAALNAFEAALEGESA